MTRMSTVDARPALLNIELPASGPVTVTFEADDGTALDALSGMLMWVQPRNLAEAEIDSATAVFDTEEIVDSSGRIVAIVATLSECSGFPLPGILMTAVGSKLFTTGTAVRRTLGTRRHSTTRVVSDVVNVVRVSGWSTSGGGGTPPAPPTDHSTLDNRGAADAHPTAAITGLDAALGGKADAESLSDVALTGSYDDLSDVPTLGELAPRDDVTVAEIAAEGTPSGSTYLRGDGTWATPEGGGGGGAVDSVNGQTGAVVLTPADIGAATAEQGALADTSIQPDELAVVATSGEYLDLTGTPSLVAPLNGVTGLWIGTETQYAAISSPSATVVYVVVED